ncbi:MAG: nucleoside:proton symporter [Rhodospirillales bacterium]|nr:nucleoside:proton symporter [Rhodospirillales bacterium]
MLVWQSLLGLVSLTIIAWVIGGGRSKQPLKTAAIGLGLQILIALVLMKMPMVKDFFMLLGDGVQAVLSATRIGTSFVFGYLGGGDLPFAERYPGSSFILAFQALPLILVMSALSALLFHWRILPVIVRGFSWCLQRTMSIGGAVGVAAAANVFVGMIEAPLLIRPYLRQLSRSELFMVMTCGMATVAGTVMVLYATFISAIIPDSIGHILSASVISAPAAIMIARLMEPGGDERTGGAMILPPSDIRSSMEAVTRGTMDGVTLLLNVTAMLIVLVALVALVNAILGLVPPIDGEPLSVQRALGWGMAPVVWLIGIPWSEAPAAGALMGTKTILNEFIAYLQLAGLPEGTLSHRSRLIMTYALCGFANFGSLGIMIGGMSAMAPERRSEIVSLGLKSIVSGTLATLMTGAVVGILI